ENKLPSQIVKAEAKIDPGKWEGNCQSSESTLHQIAPYVGKMKSQMAQCLIESSSRHGDLVLDPFVGSGVVALECAIHGRGIFCSDVNPYAVTLTKAKLTAPATSDEALTKAHQYLSYAKVASQSLSLEPVPSWVKPFFHLKTLKEILALAELLRENEEHFLLACLLGILQHQRPGFLSFPASHLVPYLRTRKFPKENHPELYEYRDIAPRLENKIQRVYRCFPTIDPDLPKKCIQCDATTLNLLPGSVDAVITSPPYMNALSYGRDNRLRLWLLGVNDYRSYDQISPRNPTEFRRLMGKCLAIFQQVLRSKGTCVLVLGEVHRAGYTIDTAQLVIELATKEIGNYNCEDIISDTVPDIRRARKGVTGVKQEWIVVLRKR
ncbi:DNA adenine methylase, partial [bacterium]|nr:DNA adenine methylase [bacterium]